MTGPRNIVVRLVFAPDGRRLASVSLDGTVRLWDVAGRAQTAVFRHPIAQPFTAAFSPDGRRLAIGDERGRIEIRSVDPAGECRSVRAHRHQVCMAVSRNGRALATGDCDRWTPRRPGTVKLWNLASSESPTPLLLERTPVGVRSLAFSPDGRALAVGRTDGFVRLWDVAARRLIRTIPRPGAGRIGPSLSDMGGLAFLDGRRLAIARDRRIEIRDAGTGRLVRRIAPTSTAMMFSFLVGSRNGRYLAQNGDNGGVLLWDLDSGANAPAVLGRDIIISAVFSPDGRILASGSFYAGTVDLWDLRTHRRIGGTLRGPGGDLSTIDFSPDGRTLAEGHCGSTVNLWDVASRRLELSLNDERSNVGYIAALFTPDGKTLVTADDSGTVRFRSAPVTGGIDRPYSPILPPLEEPAAARRTGAFAATGVVPRAPGLAGRFHAIPEGGSESPSPGDPGPAATGRRLKETVDRTIDLHWGGETPVAVPPLGGFRARWTGYLRAPRTGRYALEIESAQGARLEIDDRRVLDDWTVGGIRRNGVRLDLERGWHRVDLDFFQDLRYYELTPRGAVRLRWVTPGDRWSRVVPPDYLGH